MGQIMDGVARINDILRQGSLDQERMSLQRSQEARLNEQARAEKAKQDDIDRVNALNKSADAAGAKVFDGYRADHILNGGDQNDYTPTPDHVASAYRARGQEYIKAGDMTGFLKNHAEGAAARAQVRSDLVKDAMSSGDPMAVMKAMNTTVDNGITLSDIKPVSLPSQDPNSAGQAYQATYTLPDGSTRSEMLNANDISKRAAYVLANPAEIAKQELAYDLNRQKINGTITEQNNKASNDQETHRQELKGRKEVVGLEGANRLKAIGAEGSEQRSTAAYKDGLDRAKPVMFNPGQELKAPVKQPDGTTKFMTVARSSQKKGGGLSDKELNTIVINNYGVLDPGTGRQVGSDKTAALSAAAAQLMQANEGLDANTAIVQAAQDLGLNIKAKK